MKTRIKELRARNNLTKVELAQRVSVRRETIVFLERGKYNPSLKVGLKTIQRDGLDYEFTVVFDLDIKHHATCSKDRIGL